LLGRLLTTSSTALERHAATAAFLDRVVFSFLFPAHLYPEIRPGQQACASELVQHLLESLCDTTRSLRLQGSTVPALEPDHRIQSRFLRECTHCNNKSEHIDNWLVLRAPPDFQQTQLATVEELLEHSLMPHEQPDLHCGVCGTEQTHLLGRGSIINRPSVLVLQFSRRTAARKLSGDLAVPQVLRLPVEDGKGATQSLGYACASTAEHSGPDRAGHYTSMSSPGQLLRAGTRSWVPINDEQAQRHQLPAAYNGVLSSLRRRAQGDEDSGPVF
jgi:hypothetical protein